MAGNAPACGSSELRLTAKEALFSATWPRQAMKRLLRRGHWRRGWFFVKPATSDAPVTVAATSTASAAAATAAAAKLHSNRRFRLHFAAGVPGQARHDRAGSRRPGGLQEPVGIDGDPGGPGLRATRAGARCRHGARQRPDRRSDRHRNRHRARCLRRQDRERAFLFRRNRRDRRSDFPRHGSSSSTHGPSFGIGWILRS